MVETYSIPHLISLANRYFGLYAPDGGTVKLKVKYNNSQIPDLELQIQGRVQTGTVTVGDEIHPTYETKSFVWNIKPHLPETPYELVDVGTHHEKKGPLSWEDYVEGPEGLGNSLHSYATSGGRSFEIIRNA